MTILSNSKDAAAPSEISHGAHPEHTLRRRTTTGAAAPGAADLQFQCDGCKEPGAGDRYACRPCDFDLHVECALAEPALAHPLFKDAELRLQELLRPGAGHDDAGSGSGSGSGSSILCVACGGEVLGLHYHCDNAGKGKNKEKKKKKQGLDIHPCCAALPREIRQEELTLELRKEAFHRCDSCRSRWDRGGWFYRSTCKTVYLHVACVKGIMISGGSGGSSGSTDPLAAVKEAALRIYRAKRDEEGEVERLILSLILGG